MTDTVAVPRRLVRPLWLGLCGAALFTAMASLQGAVRPGYDPWHQSVRFSGDPNWRGWATGTQFVALMTPACVVVFGVWSTKATGLAGSFERIAILASPMWGVAFVHRLWKATPFMVANPTH